MKEYLPITNIIKSINATPEKTNAIIIESCELFLLDNKNSSYCSWVKPLFMKYLRLYANINIIIINERYVRIGFVAKSGYTKNGITIISLDAHNLSKVHPITYSRGKIIKERKM